MSASVMQWFLIDCVFSRLATNANTVETILHGSVGLLTARSGGHLVTLQCYVSPYDIFEEGTGSQLNLTDNNGKWTKEVVELTNVHLPLAIGFAEGLWLTLWTLYSSTFSGCQCFCDNWGNLCRLQAPNRSTDHWIPPSGQQGVRKCFPFFIRELDTKSQ